MKSLPLPTFQPDAAGTRQTWKVSWHMKPKVLDGDLLDRDVESREGRSRKE